MYEDMDPLVAMERGLRTWARWVDSNIDRSRTRLFFQGTSPNHYEYVNCFFSLILSFFFSPPKIVIPWQFQSLLDFSF